MATTHKSKFRFIVQLLLWSGLVIIVAGALLGYFRYRDIYPSTDDAYVQANVVNVAAQVSGPVTEIHIANNQHVNKGQLLLVIDPRPFEAALEDANASLRLAIQQMNADVAAVEVAKANIEKAKAQQIVNQKNYRRTSTLVAEGQASKASGDDAKGELDSANAAVVAANNQLIEAQQQLGDIGDRNANIRKAKAHLVDTHLNLSYTSIYAPADGYITNFETRVGSMITAQQGLFQLVEDDNWYLYANFKETQMKRIRDQQKATIKIDMYPDHRFTGTVNSISRGSGSAFSLLPPENATGNWVKVTQRFPIKVVFDQTDANYPLRVGASATVTVDTTSKS
ncbi:MAG: hypothetical protein CMF50_06775 [Legionellales bacterium]|nr:hypothetical protein [Legionellales bacterium]|tara:strand:- start:37803 stop:38819 length:1017 start_codon:yes stop_codon:yes gene_type:complete